MGKTRLKPAILKKKLLGRASCVGPKPEILCPAPDGILDRLTR
jgi:hypothetical protein